MSKGKLIVLEGIDGSGKSTQYRLLRERFEREGIAYHSIVFPRYEEPSSALIRMYLGGDFGEDPNQVNACAASAFYTVDRFASYKQDWGADYEAGALILADRYTTSNAVHQGCKVPVDELSNYFDWLYDFEYVRMDLPKPDMVIYLDVDLPTSLERLRSREMNTGTHADIHERDTEYLRRCLLTGQLACKHYGWQRIDCFDAQGNVREKHEKHEEIYQTIKKAGLI